VLTLATAFCAIEINEGGYWAATMHVARTDSGAATGVLNTGGNVGGIVCQPIVAALSGAGMWSGAFVSASLFALAAAAAWLLVDSRQSTHSGIADPGALTPPVESTSVTLSGV
jgi:sugar phosphate permease